MMILQNLLCQPGRRMAWRALVCVAVLSEPIPILAIEADSSGMDGSSAVADVASEADDFEGNLEGVQLWENGPYWSECNVGAAKPEGYGACFKWDDAKDAVSTYFGSSWRLPTKKEFEALISKCDAKWTTRNGVSGRLVTGRGAYASKSLFFPAAGVSDGTDLYNAGSYGYYWSSTLDAAYSNYAWYLCFDSDSFDRYSYYISDKMSVRPVRNAAHYTIKFDVNDEWFHGGSATSLLNADVYPATGTMSEQSYVEGQDVALSANLYVREGFEFGGWATAANFDVLYQDGATVKAADLPASASGLTLYAVWKAKEITVTFNYQNWPGASKNIKTERHTVGYASNWSHFESGTAEVIDGWYTAATGGTRVDNVTWWIPTVDTTYYLHWRYKTCTIKYDANGGEGYMSDQSFTLGIGQALSLNQFGREGYTFGGWAKSSDGEVVYSDGQSVLQPTVVDGDTVTLYAIWVQDVVEIVTHTVAFDLGSHGTRTGGGELTQSVEDGAAAVAPTVTAEDGWRFSGWSVDFSKVTSDLTVVAVYEVVQDAQSLNVNTGWNWISLNVTPTDASISSVFAGVSFSDEDVVKSADGFATYSGGKWYGELTTIKPGVAYMVKKSTAGSQTLTVTGVAAATSVDVVSGWNWIGPTAAAEVSLDALTHSGGFADEDVIKSADAFATYASGKWYGELEALKPGVGYKAKFAKGGTLTLTK